MEKHLDVKGYKGIKWLRSRPARQIFILSFGLRGPNHPPTLKSIPEGPVFQSGPGAWCLVPSGPASLYSMGGAGFAERPPPTFVLGEDPIVFEQPGHLDFELRYPAVLLTRRLHSFGFECSAQPPTRRVRRSDLRRSVRAWYLHLYENKF